MGDKIPDPGTSGPIGSPVNWKPIEPNRRRIRSFVRRLNGPAGDVAAGHFSAQSSILADVSAKTPFSEHPSDLSFARFAFVRYVRQSHPANAANVNETSGGLHRAQMKIGEAVWR
jgi:hypothetical protein